MVAIVSASQVAASTASIVITTGQGKKLPNYACEAVHLLYIGQVLSLLSYWINSCTPILF